VLAGGVALRATFMAIAILKSFDCDHGVAILKLDGSQSEIAAHVTGSDRTVISSVVPGQRIRFDVGRDRWGRTFAVDVRPAGSILGRASRGRK
jgi:cold shock CspA family protein